MLEVAQNPGFTSGKESIQFLQGNLKEKTLWVNQCFWAGPNKYGKFTKCPKFKAPVSISQMNTEISMN